MFKGQKKGNGNGKSGRAKATALILAALILAALPAGCGSVLGRNPNTVPAENAASGGKKQITLGMPADPNVENFDTN